MSDKLKHVYVAYVGIGNLSSDEEIERAMKAAYDAISPVFEKVDGEVIFIPIRGVESRFECINPSYITEDEILRKHRLLMDELHEHLDVHVKKILNKTEDKDTDDE